MTDNNASHDIDEPIFPPIQYGVTEEAIAELRQKYAEPDASTEAGYELCKEGVKELTSIRTALDRRRKDLKRDALEWGRKVDSRCREITDQIREIEAPVREAKDAVDEEKRRQAREAAEAEAKRKADHQAAIARIKGTAENRDAFADAAAIGVAIEGLRGLAIDADGFDEFAEEAAQARDAALYRLKEWHELAVASEKADDERRKAEEKLRKEREAIDAEREAMQKAEARRADITKIREAVFDAADQSPAQIQRIIGRVEAVATTEIAFGEMADEAAAVKSKSLNKLRSMLESAQAVDKEKAAAAEREREARERKLREDAAAEERQRLEAEERERERERQEAEARKPDKEKALGWLDTILAAIQKTPDVGDAKVDDLMTRLAKDIDSSVTATARKIDRL